MPDRPHLLFEPLADPRIDKLELDILDGSDPDK